MEKSKNILVVEDDLRVAELLKRGLEENDFLVQLAYDGDMASRLIQSVEFDLVITDVVLPKLNGLELAKVIRKKKPEVPILMLTALGSTDDKVEGFGSGADDYLVKPFDLRELLVRITALLKRASVGSQTLPNSITYHDLRVDIVTKTVYRNNNKIVLTPKEYRLLEYMVRNAERVMSRKQIARDVWDTEFETGTNFIDVYINYLRKKIDRQYDKKLIHTRTGMGFILSIHEN